MRNPWAVAFIWIGMYLLITLSPLLVLLIEPVPPGRSVWIDFSVALGFVGLAMLALQFALTARINRIEASYGIDIVLQFHRYISLVAFGLILIHPLILFAADPQTLALLRFWEAPWRAQAALASLTALILLVVLSIWRKKLNLPYEPWRTTHGIFAIGAVGLGLAHGLGVGYYLSNPWKQALWGAIALLALWLLVYVRVIKPWFMLQHPYRVEEVLPQRGDSWTLALRPQGHPGFTFQPGQFVWLTLNRSPYRIQEHPFSFSSSALNRDRIELTIKALGDFTKTIEHVAPGTRAYLDGPYGVFTIDRYEDAAGFTFLANGVGITPFMSMLATMADRGDQRFVRLIYANKYWDKVTFREELEALKDRLNLTLIHVLTEPPEDWEGDTGYVNKELLQRHLPPHLPRNCHYFLCGSNRFLEEAEKGLHDLGVHAANIHMEHFDLV